MREIIYSRDYRVNRHKFDGVDPVVLYPLNVFVSLYLAAEPVVLVVVHINLRYFFMLHL